LVLFFADPDQLSALIILSGFSRGRSLNAIAPFGAACQSILFAYQEIGKEQPSGILGFFDVAQRHNISRELLSYTVPYSMFEEMEKGAPESFLITKSWERLEKRACP
jgi:hypothetical protein